MKNQSDLIVVIVAVVITLGSLLAFWFLKRDTVVLSAPTPVTTTPALMPAGDVSMAASLPGGGSATGGMGRGGMMGGRGGMGGPPGMGGPGMGGPGMGRRAGGGGGGGANNNTGAKAE